MLTRLNTLYVLSQGSYLSKEGECVQLRVESGEKKLLPIHMIGGGIVTFGNVLITPFLMGHCADHQIPITCLTEHGRFLARISSGCVGNVFLRRRQHALGADPVQASRLASRFLFGKLANTRTVLRRGVRERPESAAELAAEAETIKFSMQRILGTHENLDVLRGLEGDAAARYFSVFERLLTPSGFSFPGRVRRPPTDPVNALLSFLYALLAHDCNAAAIAAGLDPQLGFLHRDRPGRESLALDLMEEMRPLLADRLVLALLNRRQLTQKDFSKEAAGAVTLSDDARRTVLTSWQERKKNEIIHPFTQETIPIGLIPFVQATLLARHLRGDLEDYPPFIWR